MSMNRRGLLKALGLGGVGLVAGVSSPISEAIAAENKRLGRTPHREPVRGLVLPPPQAEPCHGPYWEHPEIDRIKLALDIMGSYPDHFAPFTGGEVFVCNGDRLNINYELLNDGPLAARWPDTLTLYRVYDVVASVAVVGTSINGPVVLVNGERRLARIDELIPNEEESRKYYL